MALETLKQGKYDSLSVAEWRYIICSIIDETYDKNFLGKVSRIDFAFTLNVHPDRDMDEGSAIHFFLEKVLSPKARAAFCQASTELAKDAYEAAIEGDGVAQDFLAYLLLDISFTYGGTVDGWIGAEVALNRRLAPEVRQSGAQNLLCRDFRSSAPDSVWKKLEREVSSCPLLAVPVMSHLAKARPFDAIKVLGKIGHVLDTVVPSQHLRFQLGDAISAVRRYSGWEEHFSDAVATLPPKALELVREMLAGAEIPDLLALLPEPAPA
jgi:hypothetical protein